MSMVTQCPHCSTAFNVTPEQLFARDGRVRCGQCKQVFDGLVNLTSLQAVAAGVPPPLAETGEAEVQARVEPIAGEHDAPANGFAPLNWPVLPDVPVVPMPPVAEVTADNVREAPLAGETDVVSANADAFPAMPIESEFASVPAPMPQAANANDGEVAIAQEMPRRSNRLWAAAAAVAALLLSGQVLHSFRSEVAAHFPALKPVLVQFCALAQCQVAPLQKPSALAIQASDLLILDKAKPNLVQLIVTLQNQSSIDVGYPAIDLVLNDRFDHAVARRVFLPADYLRGADARKTVIAASVTTTVRIDLDLSELSAGGFGLLLIPAPQT